MDGGGDGQEGTKSSQESGGGGASDAAAEAASAAAAAASAAASTAVPGAPKAAAVVAAAEGEGEDGGASPARLPSSAVRVDPKKLGVLIGPGGSTLKRIEEVSGCRVKIEDRTEAPDATGAGGAAGGGATRGGRFGPDGAAKSVVVYLEGPDEDCLAAAAKMVTDMCSKGYSAKLAGGDFTETFVEVHPRVVPDLVGSQGFVIKALRDACGVSVNLPPAKKMPKEQWSGVPEKPVKVAVAGPKEGVARAKQAIHDIVHKYYSSVTHPGMTHLEFDVPEWQVARFCGKAGANVRHIQGDSKAKVYVPREWSVNPKVVVVGYSSEVAVAKKHIDRILQNISEQANRVSSEAGFAAAHKANKLDEDDEEPYEEWMSEYMYKR